MTIKRIVAKTKFNNRCTITKSLNTKTISKKNMFEIQHFSVRNPYFGYGF